MALELGLRAVQWERYQPVEILAMRDAAERRRRRDMAGLALGFAGLMNRVPFNERAVKPEDLALAMIYADHLLEDADGQG